MQLACGDNQTAPSSAGDGGIDRYGGRLPNTLARDVDILFMIDNSAGMLPFQRRLADALPAFVNALREPPYGLPNLHVALVSSSLGTGIWGNVPGCAPNGPGNENGVFQHDPACTALPGDQHFLRSVGGHSNFTGDLAAMLACLSQVGDNGCGFEHPFESVRLALQRSLDPGDPENAAFLRANAYLAIIMLTNEDDCSVLPDSYLFDPNEISVADPRGGLQSYRCTEFGHLCDGRRPPHIVVETTPLNGCVSAEDGVLVTVSGFVDFLRTLKATPGAIVAAAIAGPTTPYVVEPRDFILVNGGMESQPSVASSCVSSPSGSVATPAVRIKQWTDAFGSDGIFRSICEAGLEEALINVARVIKTKTDPS